MDKDIAAPKTLQEAILYFSNPDTCLAFMVEQRWPDGRVLCPTCGSNRVTFLAAYRRYVQKRPFWGPGARRPPA